VISKAVISKAVISKAVISKAVISKAVISKAVISKAVISKAAVGQDLGVQHVHDTRHATAVSRHLEPSTRTPARLVRSLEWRGKKTPSDTYALNTGSSPNIPILTPTGGNLVRRR
jgi:hypothetical protein